MYYISNSPSDKGWKAKLNGQHSLLTKILSSGNIELLSNFGSDCFTNGLNANTYNVCLQKFPEGQKKHLLKHKELYLNLTDLTLDNIVFPKKYGLIGIDYNEQVIPGTAFRLGYNFYIIKKHLNTDKRNIILEIGSGWGCLPYIFNKNINSCCILIDIPSTLMIATYFLMKEKKKILLYEKHMSSITYEMTNEYDFILMIPEDINNIKDKMCDVVINTASLIEMEETYIEFYLQEINRVCNNIFYEDNALICNYKLLEKYENKYLDKFSLIFSRETPINTYLPKLYPNQDVDIFNEKLYKYIK